MQALGCNVDLSKCKSYCLKKRLCPEHLTAQALLKRGGGKELWRFCQQCGKLEPLALFDGIKR